MKEQKVLGSGMQLSNPFDSVIYQAPAGRVNFNWCVLQETELPLSIDSLHVHLMIIKVDENGYI